MTTTSRMLPEHRRMMAVGIAAIICGALLLLGVLLPIRADATQPNPEHKIVLCHATDSYTNPYVRIEVDIASVQFEGHDGA